MIFPDVDLESWRNRFNLPVIHTICAKCGKDFETIVPVALEGYAGLSTLVHECGLKYAQMILTPKTDIKKQLWRRVLK